MECWSANRTQLDDNLQPPGAVSRTAHPPPDLKGTTMRRSIIAAGAAAATLFTVVPAAEAALPAVQFTKVYYDSPGADRRSNSSLNGEYAVLKNNTRRSIQMERWILRDKTGYKFYFPRFTLKPGKTVTVRTGSGNDGTSTLYWGRGAYVWNNTGDTAGIYRRGDLKRIDTCSWGSRGDWTSCK